MTNIERHGHEEDTWSKVLARLLSQGVTTETQPAERAIHIWSDCAGMSSEMFAMKKLFPVTFLCQSSFWQMYVGLSKHGMLI